VVGAAVFVRIDAAEGTAEGARLVALVADWTEGASVLARVGALVAVWAEGALVASWVEGRGAVEGTLVGAAVLVLMGALVLARVGELVTTWAEGAVVGAAEVAIVEAFGVASAVGACVSAAVGAAAATAAVVGALVVEGAVVATREEALLGEWVGDIVSMIGRAVVGAEVEAGGVVPLTLRRAVKCARRAVTAWDRCSAVPAKSSAMVTVGMVPFLVGASVGARDGAVCAKVSKEKGGNEGAGVKGAWG